MATAGRQAGASSTPSPVRVLVVDDHAVLRRGLVDIINDADGLVVCGEASSAREAHDGVRTLKPDVVTVDVTLGEESGFDLVERILLAPSAPRVLMLSGHDEPQFVERARSVGAAGYLDKSRVSSTFVRALRRVAAGATSFEHPHPR